MAAPLDHLVVLAVALFAVGFVGFVARRNLVFTLISIDVMLNGAALMFVAGDLRWGNSDGQVMLVFVLSAAAAASAAGLSLLVLVRRSTGTLDPDALTLLREPRRGDG